MHRRHLLWIFGISLAVRLVLFTLSHGTIWEAVRTDGSGYLQLGRNLAHHGVFSLAQEPPYYRSALRTPVYPLLIALALKVTPSEEAALRLIILLQLVLGSLTAVLTAKAACLVLGPDKSPWPLVAGLVAGLEPYGIRDSLMILTETSFTFCLLLSVILLLAHLSAQKPTTWFLLASAMGFGMATLVRPVGFYIPFLLAVVCLLGDNRFPFRTRVLQVFVPFFVAYGVIVTPWMWRNQMATGQFVLSNIAARQSVVIVAHVTAILKNSHDEEREQTELFSDYLAEFNEMHHTSLRGFPNPWICELNDEKMTGNYCRFVSGKTKPIMLRNIGVIAKAASASSFRMLFSFNKDALCDILRMPVSHERTTAVVKSLITGRIREALSTARAISSLEWIGLGWSMPYSLGVTLLAALGLALLAKARQYMVVCVFAFVISALVFLPSAAAMGVELARYKVPIVPYLAVLASVCARYQIKRLAVCRSAH